MQMFKEFSDVTKLILETIEETPPVIVFKKELKRTSIADEELKSALKNVCIFEFEFLFIL